MARTSRFVFLALVAVAAAHPGCNSGSPTVPEGVLRAQIVLTVAPRPLAPIATPPFYQLTYTVTITETAGLGGELQYVNGTVFDATSGFAVGLNNYDSSDILVFVGTKRIDAGQSRAVQQQIDYGLPTGSTGGVLTVNTQFKDDRGNFISQSILVGIP
jgi:hypothetical protein